MKTENVKHTPGPWKECLGKIVADNGSKYGTVTIAHYYNDHIGIRDEASANAALIAAAPELLRACTALLALSSTKGKANIKLSKEVFDYAETAITKAEGGQ